MNPPPHPRRARARRCADFALALVILAASAVLVLPVETLRDVPAAFNFHMMRVRALASWRARAGAPAATKA